MELMEKFIHIGSFPVKKKYEISFNTKNCSFELKIRKTIFNFIENNFSDRLKEIFDKSAQDFNITNKKNNLKKYLGVNNCFSKIFEDNEWFLFSAPVKFSTGLSIVLTFVEILSILEHLVDNELPEDKDEEQDIFLDTTCSKKAEFYGAAMKANLSLKFSLWLYDQNDILRDQVNPAVNIAMAMVFKKLFRTKTYTNYSGLTKNGFLLSPPAGIYTCQFGILLDDQERFSRHKTYGYTTFCHNLDIWQQQLVLLAGFAKICESFRNLSKK